MNKKFFVYILMLVISLCSMPQKMLFAAEPLDNWNWKNPLPQGNTIRAAVNAGGQYVAVGDYGAILTSADGSNWNRWSFLNGGSPSTTANLRGIAYDDVNLKYIAIGDNATILVSSNGQTWTAMQTTATADLIGIAYNTDSGGFLALGYDGTVIRIAWTGTAYTVTTLANQVDQTTADSQQKNFNTIVYGKIGVTEYFVAAGYHGAIFSTIDGGNTWTEVDVASQIPSVNTIKSSCFDGDQFVLLAEDGSIFITIDGASLSQGTALGAGVFNSISFDVNSNKYYVAGNYDLHFNFSDPTSPLISNDDNSQLSDLSLNNGSLLNTNNGVLYWDIVLGGTSPNFSDMTLNIYKSNIKTVFDLVATGKAVSWTNGGLINLTAKNGSGMTGSVTVSSKALEDKDLLNTIVFPTIPGYYTSPDLSTWTITKNVNEKEPVPVNMYAGIVGNVPDEFFLLGGAGKIIKTDDGGDHWNISGITDNVNNALLHGVAFHNNEFYAFGGSNLFDVIYKIGAQSLKSSGGIKQFFSAGVTGNSATLFVVGSGGRILSSNDNGASWSIKSFVGNYSGIAYGNDTLVATNSSGVSVSFDNGLTWESTGSDYLSSVAYGNSKFVAVGQSGKILTSTDAKNWISQNSNSVKWLRSVAYGNGIFVAVGLNGTVLTSTDGTSWTPVTVSTTGELRGVTYGNGYFVIVGEDAERGIILTSADRANTWTARPSGSSNGLYAVVYGNNIFYAVGDFGTILYSDPVYDPAPVTVVSTSPANNATNVSPDLATVSVFFSLDMDVSTINATNFTLVKDDGGVLTPVVPTSVTYDSLTYRASFNFPASTLTENTVYTATLTTAVKDGVGRALSVAYPWTFTTGKTPDKTQPFIIPGGVSPADGASSVPVNSKITVKFSEAINPSTVTSSSFSVVDKNNAAVAGEFTFNGVTVMFTPGTVAAPVDLKNSTAYYITITNMITDLAGNPLAATPILLSFTTEPPNMTLTVSSGSNGSLTVFDKEGDSIAAPQLGKLALSGVNPLNSNSGKLYWTLEKVGANYIVSLYKDSAGASADLVSQGSILIPSGTVILLAKNSFAINGSIDIAYTADDLTVAANILTVVSAPAGTVDLAITVPNGGNRVITVTPASGHDLMDFTDGGFSVADLVRSKEFTYSLNNITSDKTLAVTFIADVVAPTVTTTSPANIATGVAQSAVITATFSKSMDTATITDKNFIVKDAGGNAILGTVSYSGLMATFTPSMPLNLNTLYNVTITTGVKDLYGNTLAAGKTWSFTTTTASFTVVASAGANGAITPTGTLTVSTGSAQTFSITPNSGYILSQILLDGIAQALPVQDAISLKYSYTQSNITANHTLAFSFAPATYALTINPVSNATTNPSGTTTANFNEQKTIIITPATGYSLASLKLDGVSQALPALVAGTYSYTTIKITANHTIDIQMSADVVAPTVTTTSPANIATGVAQSAVITATFSKSMDTATITDKNFIVKDAGGNAILGTVSYSGLMATFTPSMPLLWNMNYTVYITTGVKDTYGNALVTSKTWSFTTRPGVYIITVLPRANGTVASDSADLTKVSDSADVVFMITPNTGYHIATVVLDGASIIDKVANNNYTLSKVITNHTLDATFAINTYALTASVVANGTLTPSTLAPNYGTSPTVTIKPAVGYILESVTDSRDGSISLASLVKGAQNPDATYTWIYTISGIAENRTVSAVFRKLNLIVNAPAAGTGSVTLSTATPAYGDSPAITIRPAVGYNLESVTDSVSGVIPLASLAKSARNADGTYTWIYTISNIGQDRTLNVVFRKINLVLSPPAAGTGLLTSSIMIPYLGDSPTITIRPSIGYRLKSVTDSFAGTLLASNPPVNLVKGATPNADGTYTWTYAISNIMQSRTVSAVFELIPYSVIIGPSSNGSITSDVASVYHNGSATFTIKSSPGYTLDKLYLNGIAVSSLPTPVNQVHQAQGYVYTYTYMQSNVTQNISVSATFVQKFTVTASAVGSGAVSNSGVTVASPGASLSYNFTPAGAQYQVDSVKVDGISQPVTASYTFSNLVADHTIEVTFGIKRFLVAVTPLPTNGLVTLSSAAVNYGGSVDAVVTPAAGYKVADILLTPSGSKATSVFDKATATASGSYRYILADIKNDYSISAKFSILTFKLTTSSGVGGVITASKLTPDYSSSVTFTMVPDTGYTLLDLTVDGVSVKTQTIGNSYVLNNIKSDHAVIATFAVNSYSITSSVNNGAAGSISPSGSQRVNHGASQAYQIIPVAGATLADLQLDGVSVKTQVVNGVYTLLNVTKDHSLVATFSIPAAVVLPDGDLNRDGKVDISDALLALKMSVGLLTPTATDIAHGDVGPMKNYKPVPDGKIDINDVVVMLQRAVGNIPAW